VLQHPSLRTGLLAAVATTGVALLAPSAAVAQEFSDSDTREIANYALTEAGLAKYTQAVQNLDAVADQLPSACDDDSEQSLDELVARIDTIPAVRAAIHSAGLTAREYVVFTFSLFQNGLAAWAVSQPGGQLPPGTLMANVNFYRAHEAALQALGEQMQAVDCDDGGDDEDEDQ
jgi:hypothetical protein